MNQSFILYVSYYDSIQGLTLEQKGQLLDAIFCYQIEGKVIEMDGVVKMAFGFIKQHLDTNKKKYNSIIERNRVNGMKGGRPPNPNKPTGLSKRKDIRISQKPSGISGILGYSGLHKKVSQKPSEPSGISQEASQSGEKTLSKKTQNPKNPDNDNGNDINKENITKEKKLTQNTVTENMYSELDEIKNHYNQKFSRDVKTAEPLLEGFVFWRQWYSCEDIKLAITTARNNRRFGSELDFQFFFKQTNKQGEKVDFIGAFLSKAPKKAQTKNSDTAGKYSEVKTELTDEQKKSARARVRAWDLIRQAKKEAENLSLSSKK